MPRMTSWSQVSPPFCWRVTPAVLRTASYRPSAACASSTLLVTTLMVEGTFITSAPRKVPALTVTGLKPSERTAVTCTACSVALSLPEVALSALSAATMTSWAWARGAARARASISGSRRRVWGQEEIMGYERYVPDMQQRYGNRYGSQHPSCPRYEWTNEKAAEWRPLCRLQGRGISPWPAAA